MTLQEAEPISIDSFIEQKLPKLLDQMKPQKTAGFSFSVLDSRPSELSNLDLLQPHYQNYDENEIRSLFKYSEVCLKSLIPKKLAPELQKALIWIKFTCQQGLLPQDYFKKSPYVFPSGKSFVKLAEEKGVHLSLYLTEPEILNYKSVTEDLFTNEYAADLNFQQIKGLQAGEEFLLGRKYIFILQKNPNELQRVKVYEKVPKEVWQYAFKEQPFYLEPQFSSQCWMSLSNACWVLNKNISALNQGLLKPILFSLDALLLGAALLFFIYERRRQRFQKENQKFALQMLTHELRTPATTLTLLLENMRQDFDQFSSEQQVNFLKMGVEVSRIKNSMQMSYAYLQTDALSQNRMKINFEKIEINSFLTDLISLQNLNPIQLCPTERPIYIEAERFWLKLCFENLIQNAFDHGKPPVLVSLIVNENTVGICVTDQGEIQQPQLIELFRPFQKGAHSKGLGLGLPIIQQIMSELNGKLDVKRNPTQFTLFIRRLE